MILGFLFWSGLRLGGRGKGSGQVLPSQRSAFELLVSALRNWNAHVV